MAPKTDVIGQLRARIVELEEEIERLSKLAYIGEHQFDDCTWKHRHGELRAQLATAQEQIANETVEACAKACEDVIGNTPHDQRMLAAIDCAVMLRNETEHGRSLRNHEPVNESS